MPTRIAGPPVLTKKCLAREKLVNRWISRCEDLAERRDTQKLWSIVTTCYSENKNHKIHSNANTVLSQSFTPAKFPAQWQLAPINAIWACWIIHEVREKPYHSAHQAIPISCTLDGIYDTACSERYFWLLSCLVGYLPSHRPEAWTSGTASALNPNWATSVMPSCVMHAHFNNPFTNTMYCVLLTNFA